MAIIRVCSISLGVRGLNVVCFINNVAAAQTVNLPLFLWDVNKELLFSTLIFSLEGGWGI